MDCFHIEVGGNNDVAQIDVNSGLLVRIFQVLAASRISAGIYKQNIIITIKTCDFYL